MHRRRSNFFWRLIGWNLWTYCKCISAMQSCMLTSKIRIVSRTKLLIRRKLNWSVGGLTLRLWKRLIKRRWIERLWIMINFWRFLRRKNTIRSMRSIAPAIRCIWANWTMRYGGIRPGIIKRRIITSIYSWKATRTSGESRTRARKIN